MASETDANNHKKQTFTGLAKRLTKLSSEQRRAALEASASLAGVSLRVSREFVEAVPKAARVLSADDLRNWAEFGRRLAMGNADLGAKFFADGVSGLKIVPEAARPLVFKSALGSSFCRVQSRSKLLSSYRVSPKKLKTMSF
jgi:hypothetical protein